MITHRDQQPVARVDQRLAVVERVGDQHFDFGQRRVQSTAVALRSEGDARDRQVAGCVACLDAQMVGPLAKLVPTGDQLRVEIERAGVARGADRRVARQTTRRP